MDDFQVFVKPAGALCNLGCSYCYYLDKQSVYPGESRFLMTDEVLEAYIVQHISLTAGPELFFSWHGGEPTLAGRAFYRRAIELQKKHSPPNSLIVNGIQTNGTLLDHEWCQFLKDNNFIVGISLDGPQRIHSIHRNHRNGKPSWEEAIRGYRLLKRYGIPCEILCVVSADNADFPLEVYRFFRQLEAEYITFLPLVEKSSVNDREVSGRSVPAGKFGRFLSTVFDEWVAKDIGRIKVQVIEEALRTAFRQEHSLCIFRKNCGRVPVVEHNGDFYPCDHYVGSGHLGGNILSSPLSELLDSPRQKAFGQNKSQSLPAYCRNCEVLEMCNGACPKDRLLETPEGEPGLNYLCEGYRMFFKHCRPFIEQVASAWKA